MNKIGVKAGIRVYYCRNASYAGDVVSALGRLELNDDAFVEPVPCGGRIDPRYILKAFEGGAEAVCILTCCEGHCKMMEGNFRARRRTHAVRALLAEAGLDPDCLQIYVPESPELAGAREAAETVRRAATRERISVREVLV